MSPPRHRPAQRGAALLLAMVILTVISTMAAGMIWQQWRSAQAESAERARAQASWILSGALDWARLILREDARNGGADHLGEPWAVPLAEAKLSTFLAAAAGDGAQDVDLSAFLSGTISDELSKFNLRNLVQDGKWQLRQQQTLEALGNKVGLAPALIARIIESLQRAWVRGEASNTDSIEIGPEKLSDLAWLGLEPDSLEALRPWITLLPTHTPININTASGALLAAAVEGLDAAAASRLEEARRQTPFRSLDQAANFLPRRADGQTSAGLTVSSNFFEVVGRIRLEDRIMQERSLVERRQLDVIIRQRERLPLPSKH